LDREYDKYKLKSFHRKDKQWINRKDFKIEKDKQDIKDLFETTIDQTKLEQIVAKTNSADRFYETIKTIIEWFNKKYDKSLTIDDFEWFQDIDNED
jgi:hypothetical protein